MERPRSLRSSVWRLGSIEYKKMDKRRVEIMKCVYIYRYISFTMGVFVTTRLVVGFNI
jgi:hypothetical protein